MPVTPRQTHHTMTNLRDGIVIAINGMEDVCVEPLNYTKTSKQLENGHKERNNGYHNTSTPSGYNSPRPIHFKYSDEFSTHFSSSETPTRKTMSFQQQILTDVYHPNNTKNGRQALRSVSEVNRPYTSHSVVLHRSLSSPQRRLSQPNNKDADLTHSGDFFKRSLAMRVLRTVSSLSSASKNQTIPSDHLDRRTHNIDITDPHQIVDSDTDYYGHISDDNMPLASPRRKNAVTTPRPINVMSHQDPRRFGSQDSGISSSGKKYSRAESNSQAGSLNFTSTIENKRSHQKPTKGRSNRNMSSIRAWVSSSAGAAIPEVPETHQLDADDDCPRDVTISDNDNDSVFSSSHNHPSDVEPVYSPAASDSTPKGRIPRILVHQQNSFDDLPSPRSVVPIDNDNTELLRHHNTRPNDGSQNAKHSQSSDTEDFDEPEYLDSFQDALYSSPRRPSLWSKLRHLGPVSLRDQAVTPTDRTYTSSLGYAKGTSSRLSTVSSERNSKEERCPNCNEVLLKARPTYVAVKGNEKTFLTWILSKWGKRQELKNFGASSHQGGYLPHYCNFVRSKTLHDRSRSPGFVTDDDDDIDDGYITNTDLSPTEADLQRRISKSAPVKAAPSTTATDGTRDNIKSAISIRANSPSSTGYDPESLFERLKEEGLAASRNPIQIPTTEEQAKDLDALDSSRSKLDTSAVTVVDSPKSDKDKETQDLPQTPVKPPTPTPTPKPKPKRAPCVKKEKMPVKEKKKKGKKKDKEASQEQPDTEGEKTQVSEHKDDGPTTGAAAEITVDVAVPDLPTLNATTHASKRHNKRRASKQKISAPVLVEKVNKAKPVSEEPSFTYYDFGDLANATAHDDSSNAVKAPKFPSYLNDRMVLSLQSSRFELPMDMKSLETMSPQEYLKKYCVVSTRRKTLYNKVFLKYKERNGLILGKNNLCKALQDVLVNAMSDTQGLELCDLLEVEHNTTVDLKLFCGVAALAERILYPDFVTDDTADRTEYHKEKVECADFCALEWKLHGVEVSPHIRKLLESLG